jgi:hypothetical protein
MKVMANRKFGSKSHLMRGTKAQSYRHSVLRSLAECRSWTRER